MSWDSHTNTVIPDACCLPVKMASNTKPFQLTSSSQRLAILILMNPCQAMRKYSMATFEGILYTQRDNCRRTPVKLLKIPGFVLFCF